MSIFHFNAAKKYIKDENEQCATNVTVEPNSQAIGVNATFSLRPGTSKDVSGDGENAFGKGSVGYQEHSNEPASSPNLSSCGNNKPDGVPEVTCDAFAHDRPECNVRGRRFLRRTILDKHMTIRTGNKPYKCSLCERKFQTNHERKLHELRHKACPVCGGRYILLSTHMRIHSTDRHVCSVCKKAFRVVGQLKNHMLTHSDESPYICSDCSDRFRTSSALKQHMVTHEEERSRECTISGKTFGHTKSLKGDMRIRRRGSRANLLGQGPGGYKKSSSGPAVSSSLSTCGDIKFDELPKMNCDAVADDRPQCNVCGRRFVRQIYLDKHMSIHTGEKPHKCSFCDMKFRDCHQRTLHELGHKGMLPQCNVCGGRFVSLSKHMLTHSTDNFNYVCSVCQKAFRMASKLKSHMLIHSGEKPCTCADCGRRFRCSSNLKCHMKIHTNEKNHVCTVCGKLFTASGGLTNHMRTHSGEKPYCCETCGKAFSQKGGLDTHRSTHTSEMPFSCSTCGKQFRLAYLLRTHELIHSGEQPYECSVCGMKFNQSSSMKRHMLVHTGEKPYSCSECGERFRQSGGLASHRRRHCPKIKE